jgi:hypothetical protein
LEPITSRRARGAWGYDIPGYALPDYRYALVERVFSAAEVR